MNKDLPLEFLDRMQILLGEEYEEFLKTYDDPRRYGLRVNTAKISTEEFRRIAPFHLRPIPWTENGFFYEKEDDPARHPFYYAGLYYLQEPSAMAPAQLLPVNPGDYVLDLCAAPGGKATELAARLKGEGLLVANEISASRAKALLRNLEIFGIKNSFITNTNAFTLALGLGEFFDKILIDAPCSGEGMFRKDIANAKAWSLQKVADCAAIQHDITREAVKMLRPGGMMLYSTCTFSAEEDEQIIDELLKDCPEMELLELPQMEGFSRGRRDIGDKHFEADMEKCIRLFPHKLPGEGHFAALMRKKGSPGAVHIPTVQEKKEKSVRIAGKKSQKNLRSSSGKEENQALEDFLKDVSMPFMAGQLEIRKDQAYLMPVHQAALQVPFLRNGLYLGEIRKNRFEPSQSLAMALKMDEYASILNLSASDDRVRRYLCGETLDIDEKECKNKKGWQLVCVEGYPLGWGKLVQGTLKNKLHAGWRMNG